MKDADDRELVERFRAGEDEAFRELFRRHWPRIHRLCWRLCRDEGAAEDMTQEVFLAALEKLESFRGESEFSTWLYRIGVNRSLAWLRKRDRRRELPLEEVGEHSLAAPTPRYGERGEMREALQRAVAELPPRQRAVFVLRTGEDLPFAEIAELMGRSVGGTKANYHLAVRNLRRKLAPFAEEEGAGIKEEGQS